LLLLFRRGANLSKRLALKSEIRLLLRSVSFWETEEFPPEAWLHLAATPLPP
jgi:hypothetical protein